ncbi:MAG: calcium/sodium antiporter [Planctomycetota bacterium]
MISPASVSVIVGLLLLVVGGEVLVRGASGLATAFRISPLVIGLTVVAFGTSAPELGVSLNAAYAGNAGVAVGNVVGSNIINVLFVLGSAALIAPLIVNRDLLKRDLPLMLIASIAFYVMGWDGKLSQMEGVALFVALLIYVTLSIVLSRRQQKKAASDAELSPEEEASPSRFILNIVLFLIGLGALAYGSNLLVDGATTIAARLGVSDTVIGLTVVAIGTSLPEVVTSVVASLRGERDLAVGNVIGSNLFNILCVLGFTAAVFPEGIPIAAETIDFDLPVMVATAVITLPIFMTGNSITRWEGGLFIGCYSLYTVALILLTQTTPPTKPLSDKFLVYGVVPIVALTFVFSMMLGSRGTAPDRNGEAE